MKQYQICVVGAGAVGITFALLLRKVADVSLVVKDAQKQKLSRNPLSIEGFVVDEDTRGDVAILDISDLAQVASGSHILVCVKAYDLDMTLIQLEPLIDSARSLSLCSNGLNIFLQASQYVGRRVPLIRCLPSFGVQRISASTVCLAGELNVSLATLPEYQDTLRNLCEGFESAGFRVNLPKDVATAEWQKALVNIVVNSICSIHEVPNGAIRDKPDLQKLALRALSEVVEVASLEGFDLSSFLDPNSAQYLFTLLTPYATNFNSTLVDLRAGKKTEGPQVLGRFLSIARHYERECPTVSKLYELLQEKERINANRNLQRKRD